MLLLRLTGLRFSCSSSVFVFVVVVLHLLLVLCIDPWMKNRIVGLSLYVMQCDVLMKIGTAIFAHVLSDSEQNPKAATKR